MPSWHQFTMTAHCFQDDSIGSLPDVIDADPYERGDAGNYPIVLTSDEKSDLLAFLESLTDT